MLHAEAGVDRRADTDRILSPVALRLTPLDRFWWDDMDAENRFEKVRAAIEQLGPTDHACTLYDRREEEVPAARFLGSGGEILDLLRHVRSRRPLQRNDAGRHTET